MIDVVNRFLRLIIDMLLRVQELGKNDESRNFYKWWISIKRGGYVYKWEVGGGVKCSFHY